MSALIVFSTFPDESSARKAATRLVEERVAACASVLPGMVSIFRWQEKMEEANEVLLMIKTTRDAYPQLESSLKACHPYELPEILAVGAEAGLPAYFDWITQEIVRNK